MTTTVTLGATPTRPWVAPPALPGLGALASFVGSAVPSAIRCARRPAARVRRRPSGASPDLTAVLMGAYALLGIAVTGTLAVRLGRRRHRRPTRLAPLLGARHVLLMTPTVAAPAAGGSRRHARPRGRCEPERPRGPWC